MSWKLHEGDCVDYLPAYAGQADLVLTSPPYGGLRDYGGHGFNWERVAEAIVPCLTEGGVLVWVVADETIDGSESGDSYRQALWFMDAGLKLHDTMIFRKRGSGGKTWKNRHFSEFEFMFVFSQGRPRVFSPIHDRRYGDYGRTMKGSVRRKDGSMKPQKPRQTPRFGPRGNVWEYTTGAFSGDFPRASVSHPARMTPALARDHIRTWTDEGDLVLDPMAGSGTTLLAALQLGRRAVGMEINRPYCELIRNQIKFQEGSA